MIFNAGPILKALFILLLLQCQLESYIFSFPIKNVNNLTDCVFINGSGEWLACNGTTQHQKNANELFYRPRILILNRTSNDNFNNLNISFDNLETIDLQDCSFDIFEFVLNNISFDNLQSISYSINNLERTYCNEKINSDLLDNLSQKAPNLKILKLINVGLCKILDFTGFNNLNCIDLSRNELEFVPSVASSVETLNVSYNKIKDLLLRPKNSYIAKNVNFTEFNNESNVAPKLNLEPLLSQDTNDSRLIWLNLCGNDATFLDGRITSFYPRLKTLILSDNPLTKMPRTFSYNEQLELIELKGTKFGVLDLSSFKSLPKLQYLSLENSSSLRFIDGLIVENLPSIKSLNFRNCSLKYLNYDIFDNLSDSARIDLSLNAWTCDCRSIGFVKLGPNQMLNVNDTSCSMHNDATKSMRIIDFLEINDLKLNCSIGATAENGAIVRTLYGSHKIMDCEVYGQPQPQIVWYKYSRGKFDKVDAIDFKQDFNADNKFISYPDGTLQMNMADRSDIGIYLCQISNRHGNLTVFQRFRLDYAYIWWLMKVYSLICGILLAMAFFALHVIAGSIRRLIVWRISKLERTGRVRMLLESIEKYRSRQLVNLHDMYASNINQIRENYHQQSETLRRSYSAQAERFRDYRATQMEHVANHLDALRDNYNSQVHRIRDYGSKQMERVWNVYQGRVSRLRNYSLQQRLRLMRQYKLKQRYINRILENLNLHGSGTTTGGQQNDADDNSNPQFIEMHYIKPPNLPEPIDMMASDDDGAKMFGNHMGNNNSASDLDLRGGKGNLRRCSSDSFLLSHTKPKCASDEQGHILVLQCEDGTNAKADDDNASFHSVMSEDFEFEDKAKAL